MKAQELAVGQRISPSAAAPAPGPTYRSGRSRRISPSSNFTRPPPSSSPPLRPLQEDTTISDNKLLLHSSSSASRRSSFSSSSSPPSHHHQHHPHHTSRYKISSLIRSFLNLISAFQLQTLIPTNTTTSCLSWLALPTRLPIVSASPIASLGRKVTGTLFGHRRGHVSFAVQDSPQSEPVLLLELAISTASLVREMSSGLVRIALECDKKLSSSAYSVATGGRPPKLFQEPTWTMYCNGRKCGYAVSRACGDFDWHVLRTVQTVSVGAGVIPVVDDGGGKSSADGELLYMRARFERVVGSRDSEAFYMLNPDGNGGPELSIFLLRI